MHWAWAQRKYMRLAVKVAAGGVKALALASASAKVRPLWAAATAAAGGVKALVPANALATARLLWAAATAVAMAALAGELAREATANPCEIRASLQSPRYRSRSG
jgi:hypothetical protein